MSGYGYLKRDDPAPRVVPSSKELHRALEDRTRAPRSKQEKPIAGSVTLEDFASLEEITETVVTPESVTTPTVLAATVTALEGQFASLSALSANMGEVTAGVVRDSDDQLRLDMDNKVIRIEDDNETPRVILGQLGPDPEEWGIVVYGELGDLILGANGLGTNVVGSDQVEDGSLGNDKIVNLSAAKIDQGFLNVARIQDASIGNAKIASLAVNKLLAGALGVGRYIESVGYSAGSSGWRINANGNAEFNNVTIRGTLDGVSGTFSGSLSAVSGTFGTITAGLLQYNSNRFLDLSATGADPFFRFDDVIFRADGTREWPDEVQNPPAIRTASQQSYWFDQMGDTVTRFEVEWSVNSVVTGDASDYRISIDFYRGGEFLTNDDGIAIGATQPYEKEIGLGDSSDMTYAIVYLYEQATGDILDERVTQPKSQIAD